MRLLLIWPLASVGLMLLASPAAAQLTRDEIELRNEVYQLQQQVQGLQQAIQSRGGGSYLGRPGGYQTPQAGAGSDMVAQLLARVQTLEEAVRDLHGRVDETQNQVQQQAAQLGKRIDDLSFQIGQGPQSRSGMPPGPPGPAPAGSGPPASEQRNGLPLAPPPDALGTSQAYAQPPPAPVRRTPEQTLQAGNAALARRDYAAAETAARNILSNYRTSPRAYDAQFLLAQALAGQRQYSQAAIAFDDAYNRNRKGTRAPAALIGLANALAAINEKRAACDTLAKLRAEFPQAHGELEQAVAVEQRSGCH